MDLKLEIEKLGKDLTASVGDEIIEVSHKDFLFDYDFYRLDNDNDTLSRIKDFLSYDYVEGRSVRKKDYYEAVIAVKNYYLYGGFEDDLDIEATNFKDSDIYYSIGELSDDLGKFLYETITWDNFSTEYFISLKIFNANTVLRIDSEDEIKKVWNALAQRVFFELHHNHNLQVELLNLSDYEKYDTYYYEEKKVGPIDSTVITFDQFDNDLISYYNRASIMVESEFMYLAYFQVLECIFDEVYKYETIQDVKGILQSNWFSNTNNDDIDSLINIVDRYNKDKNDRNKTKLVLEKYFKGELHDEAYLLVNKEIIALLTDMKLIKKKEDIKDLQMLANIIYDYRCNCTHSNRSYPIKQTTIISNDNLEKYITLIRKISERIILNYKRN